ncbi:MAG: hypothetical protein ABIB41_10755 [Nitrospirota bacterium]
MLHISAKQEIIKLVRFTIDEWFGTLLPLFGIIGYLFKTLEYAARGLRQIVAHSLDDSLYPGQKKRGDKIAQDSATGEIVIFSLNNDAQ